MEPPPEEAEPPPPGARPTFGHNGGPPLNSWGNGPRPPRNAPPQRGTPPERDPHLWGNRAPTPYSIYARYANGWFFPPPDRFTAYKIQQVEDLHTRLIEQGHRSGMDVWPAEMRSAEPHPIEPNSYIEMLYQSNRDLSNSLNRFYNRQGQNRVPFPNEGMGQRNFVTGHGDQLSTNQGRRSELSSHHSPRSEVMKNNDNVQNWDRATGTSILLPRPIHDEIHRRDMPTDRARQNPYDAQEHDLENMQRYGGVPDARAQEIRDRNADQHGIKPPPRHQPPPKRGR